MNCIGSTNYILILLGLLSFSSFAQSKNTLIKVRLDIGVKEVLISGIDIKVDYPLKKSKFLFRGRKSLKISCHNSDKSKSISGKVLAHYKSVSGVITYNKKQYRGDISLIAKRDGRCDVVNEIPLEVYISTLLAKEMHPDWPIEALKAQAVAARSYAYHKIINKRLKQSTIYHDITNSEMNQVNGSFTDITYNTDLAAKETAGQILTLSSGKLTPIFFHSKCGGKTLLPEEVWSHPIEGYQSVSCPFCHKHGKKEWKRNFSSETFASYIKKAFKKASQKIKGSHFNIAMDSKSTPYIKIKKNQQIKELKKSYLRKVMGRKNAPSNYYHVTVDRNQFVLKGRGFGHGVGMCQFGTFELAQRGYNYNQILSHYFPNHKVRSLY